MMSAQDTSMLDSQKFAGLVESVGGDLEFVAELAATFFAEAERLIVSLDEGLATGDVDLVRRSAHTIKSTSSSMALVSLAEVAGQLEAEAKSGDLSNGATLAKAISALYPSARAALESKVSEK